MPSIEVVFPSRGVVDVWECTRPAPGPGEILCRMTRSLISTGTESLCLRGDPDPDTNWSEWLSYPFRPGYSAVARVEAVGEGVTKFRIGDRVTAGVAHQSHFVIASDDAIRIPDEISDEDAAWATISYIAQLGVRRAALQLGESVGVVGVGILGQMVTQYLAISGARQIVAIDTSPARLALARAHGATDIIQADVSATRPQVIGITNGQLLDVVLDVTGNPAVLASATRLVRRLGRVVLLGDTTTPTRQTIGTRIVADSIGILGIHGSMHPHEATPFNMWTRHAMTDLFFTYLRQQRMRVADLVTHRITPAQAPAIFAQLLADRSAIGGVLIEWD